MLLRGARVVESLWMSSRVWGRWSACGSFCAPRSCTHSGMISQKSSRLLRSWSWTNGWTLGTNMVRAIARHTISDCFESGGDEMGDEAGWKPGAGDCAEQFLTAKKIECYHDNLIYYILLSRVLQSSVPVGVLQLNSHVIAGGGPAGSRGLGGWPSSEDHLAECSCQMPAVRVRSRAADSPALGANPPPPRRDG